MKKPQGIPSPFMVPSTKFITEFQALAAKHKIKHTHMVFGTKDELYTDPGLTWGGCGDGIIPEMLHYLENIVIPYMREEFRRKGIVVDEDNE